ncbi:MAG: type IX secretion system protein PorQ [Melioribacteraceae bacterium]|nr:type IX secretion system protein PorQ [Melioribacteraceae bacterium]MCF8353827.1 type IX secretion system protein PorQ [Melioribacteraceae bacterium]MCF8393663.1 type IX secretion system protein PorQ [Melioribacteraceae bacterium]MCF8419473.1 type IX secretion system protein PorQ [Melioribacteraceae bacterium]
MKNAKYLILLLTITWTSISAQSTFEFLRLDMSPRTAAIAGSFVAGDDDPNVIFYNPAGIKMLKETPVSFSFLKHLLDINSAGLSMSREFEGIGRFGAGIQYINYGTFTEANEHGQRTGEFGASEFALSVGYANELDENFYYGANIKFIYSGIADQSSTGIAGDVGLHYSIPDERWHFGFSILNIGSQMSSYFDTSEPLPLDIRLGFTKELEHMPLKLYFSFNRLNDDQENFVNRFSQFTIGGEFKVSKVIHFRLGFDNEKRRDLKIGTSTGLAGIHVGLGFNVSDYIVDYAFSSLGSIGALHRIGLSTTF